MGIFGTFKLRILRIRRLYRTFRGKCPYCGLALEWQHYYRTGNIKRWTKMCPDKHYGVENRGNGRILIYDNEGDPIDYLFDRNFRVVKDEEETVEDE